MQATIVFQKNWEAISVKENNGSNKYRYIVNRGSSRSSKTISLIQLYDLYARSFANKRQTIWRDTKTDCKKTVLNDIIKTLRRESLYGVNQIFNKTESIFTYDTFSTVEIHGTDDEETVHGLTQDLAWLNEPYKISRETFDQIDQRTSDFVFIDYNPKKGHWVEDLIKDPRTLVIDSTFRDNPFCPIEQKNKILSYQPIQLCEVVESEILTKEQAKQYDWNKNELNLSKKQINELIRCIANEEKNTANAFNWQVYGLGTKAEKPNRIFNWKPIEYSDYLKIDVPKYIGVDWGKVDPFGILEAKYIDGRLYLHELNYDSENIIREKLNATQAHLVKSDDLETNGETGIVKLIFSNLNIEKKIPIICDNNRPIKIACLRRMGFDAYEASKPKGSILDGIDVLDNLEVFYTRESKNLEYEQENYSRKVDRYGIILDEPEDINNHLIDPARYVAQYLVSIGKIKEF
jgi:PBSX family phage terminase large subunit